ncbi:hypothetical protein PTKIN_Ptkin05aG0015300 [Pterospermum kingtungense]
MDLDSLALILAVLPGTYIFLFGFLKKVNDWRYVSSLRDKKHSLPPGDMGCPIFGNTLAFLKAFRSKDPDAFINNLVSRYGRTGIYKTYLFGSSSIIVSVPETCRKVLTDDDRFALGYPASTKQLTGKKSFHNIPNSEHKRLRRLTTAPINGHEAVAMYIGYIEDIVVTSLDEWSSMNEPIELLKEMRKVFLKAITHIFVGSSAESILGSVEKYSTNLNYGLKAAAINIPGFASPKALKARKMLIKILQGVPDERRGKSQIIDPNYERGMVDLIMEVEDENGKKLEDEDLIDLLLMFLFAGHESAAHTAMWAVIYLHDHPQVLRKAKEEQEEISKKTPSTQKGLTLKDIREMNYLQMNYEPKAGSFLAFGGGSWICPGADMAKLELSIFLHYFLLNYK